jgi:hypothetical protein
LAYCTLLQHISAMATSAPPPPTTPNTAPVSATDCASTFFCDCGDMLYIHDPTIFAAASTAGTGAGRGKAAQAAAAAAAQRQRDQQQQAGGDGASWYCRRCGSSRPMVGPAVVYATRKTGGATGGGLAAITEYTIMDPTLPHEWMRCPNAQCTSHETSRDDLADVVLVRTHYARYEFAFVCTECKHKWMAAGAATGDDVA